MKTSPAPSTVNPRGKDSPVPTVVCAPPPAVTSTTRLLPKSAIKTSPAPSTATPVGRDSPVPTVVWAPPPAGTSTARLLKVSAMKTSPAASTATPYGKLSPLAGNVVRAHGPNAIAGPSPMPWAMVQTSRLPELSMSCTAPIRTPGASGAKVTFTVQVLPADTVPVQVLA